MNNKNIQTKELWKNIDGYDGVYQISSLGRVRSFKYNNPRFLKPDHGRANKGVRGDGYLYVNLQSKKTKTVYIHRLVADYFLSKNNGFDQVNHKDCNKSNNCVENSEWVSPEQNCHHAIERGRWPTPRLSKVKAEMIRFVYKLGDKTQTIIAKEFGVTQGTISAIVINKTWKN